MIYQSRAILERKPQDELKEELSGLGLLFGSGIARTLGEALVSGDVTLEQVARFAEYGDEQGLECVIRHHRVGTWARPAISQRVREEVLDRDGRICLCCGITEAEHQRDRGVGLHIDHVVPYSKGGSSEPDNLQALCGPCNLTRSNSGMTLEKLRAVMEEKGHPIRVLGGAC